MEPVGPAQIFLFALLTAAATGLGALPFLFARHPSRRWLGVSNAAAAGLMLAVSLGLIVEGWYTGPSGVLVGAGAGLIFVLLVRALLRQEEHPAVFAGLHGLDVRKGLLILVVMTAHSFTEGVALGVSFGGGADLGLFITLAVAIHNVPEGLAISLVLVPRGVGVKKAALWSVGSSLPQPLMAVPAFVSVQVFGPLLPYGLGFAAGAMVWMVFSELLPDALSEAPIRLIVPVLALSVAAMLAFQALIR